MDTKIPWIKPIISSELSSNINKSSKQRIKAKRLIQKEKFEIKKAQKINFTSKNKEDTDYLQIGGNKENTITHNLDENSRNKGRSSKIKSRIKE